MGSILTLNAGSSSIKFGLYDPDGPNRHFSGQIAGIGGPQAEFKVRGSQIPAPASFRANDHNEALAGLLTWLSHHLGKAPAVVSHRIVHGGERYASAVELTEPTIAYLESLTPLAPLHQPHGLAAIHAVTRLLPTTPQIACFDTAFHQTQASLQQRFALPRSWHDRGVRRYGFHGLSYEYIADQLPTVLDTHPGRVVVAHLGNGASACAIQNGRSVASTMGLTALDGLMMGSRCGRLDPGVVLYLQQTGGLSLDDTADLLYKQSGLLGVSGISSDMRQLLGQESPQAQEAIELFCLSAAREIASLLVPLGGLDALIFTAGIGENAPEIRARIVDHLAWLNIELDPQKNAANAQHIATVRSGVAVCVIATDEEIMLARHAANWLQRLC